jgi:hypothetical protein
MTAIYNIIQQPLVRFSVKRSSTAMRVPDNILKSVGFVTEHTEYEIGKDSYDPEGTGFFVVVPSKVIPSNGFHYFVTAKHVFTPLIERRLALTVNKKGGGITRLQIGNLWYVHEDESVDIAITPFNINSEMDIVSTPIDMFLSRAVMEYRQVGVGDEVYIPGLFTLYNPGEDPKRNIPLMRHGNIAMLPDHPIQTGSGFAEVYLIEARSIGGISGSPVFARQTLNISGRDKEGKEQMLHGLSNEFYLLGLMHGHWDVDERDINSPKPKLPQSGVNMGIGIVVPAHKILEVLNDTELVRQREECDEELRQSIPPKPD